MPRRRNKKNNKGNKKKKYFTTKSLSDLGDACGVNSVEEGAFQGRLKGQGITLSDHLWDMLDEGTNVVVKNSGRGKRMSKFQVLYIDPDVINSNNVVLRMRRKIANRRGWCGCGWSECPMPHPKNGGAYVKGLGFKECIAMLGTKGHHPLA